MNRSPNDRPIDQLILFLNNGNYDDAVRVLQEDASKGELSEQIAEFKNSVQNSVDKGTEQIINENRKWQTRHMVLTFFGGFATAWLIPKAPQLLSFVSDWFK